MLVDDCCSMVDGRWLMVDGCGLLLDVQKLVDACRVLVALWWPIVGG